MTLSSLRRASVRPYCAIPVLLLSLLASTASFAAPLTLPDALARAAAEDPGGAAASARVEAAEAAARQAAARQNPAIGVEVENFAGTGLYALLDRAEATVTYEQTWERGGKREARVDHARAQIEVVRLRGEIRRLDYLRDVQAAYAEALAAEADLVVAEARFVSAQQSQIDIDRRVKSARDPLFAGARAETLTAQAEIARDQAVASAKAARSALAAFWGGSDDFTLQLEPFFQVTPVRQSPTGSQTDGLPDLALLVAERDVALADVRVEQTRTTADPTVRAGVRYLGEDSGVALIVGGTIPLRRHDRNTANIQRAQAERNAAEAEIAAARIVREREIMRLAARMNAAAAEAERIRAEVIPAALNTVDLVRQGFNRGGFLYSDVTEAERALADARARRVAVLREHHIDRAAFDRLTGRHASLPISQPNAGTR